MKKNGYICVTEALCCTAVINTTLWFNYTSIKSRFLKKSFLGAKFYMLLVMQYISAFALHQNCLWNFKKKKQFCSPVCEDSVLIELSGIRCLNFSKLHKYSECNQYWEAFFFLFFLFDLTPLLKPHEI